MTYNVSSGTLNTTIPYYTIPGWSLSATVYDDGIYILTIGQLKNELIAIHFEAVRPTVECRSKPLVDWAYVLIVDDSYTLITFHRPKSDVTPPRASLLPDRPTTLCCDKQTSVVLLQTVSKRHMAKRPRSGMKCPVKRQNVQRRGETYRRRNVLLPRQREQR